TLEAGSEIEFVRHESSALPALSSSTYLFSNNSPEGLFQRLVRVCDVLPQRIVNQALIVTATRLFDLIPEPGEQVVIEANRNPRFSLWDRDHRPTLCSRKVVLLPHNSSS